ncbi:MAG: ATP-binding cassette domain-containing protein, partial [Zavarzinia sp.]|nr:ATP-binding cassette domain-containing protein [Zavarzinia sp.]
TGLSGGQLQRLLIARALAGNPAILVFDEATSALDAETQAIVLETLRGLSVTRIVVSHRLETLRDAGQILVIADGRLVQQGDFPTLATGPGLFARLAGLQAPTPEAGGEPDNERKADA